MKTNLPTFILAAALLTPASYAQKASTPVPRSKTTAARASETKPKAEPTPVKKTVAAAKPAAAKTAPVKPKAEPAPVEKVASEDSVPFLLAQQAPKPDPVALPEPVLPAVVEPAAPKPADAPIPFVKPEAAELAPLPPSRNAPAANVPVVPGGRPPTRVTSGIVLNFEGASLTEVLNYLSEAAGFAIVREAQLNGTVNVVSRQPLSPDEAVELLNTVLGTKGLVAIRSGRILKIVNRSGAQKLDIPVAVNSDPEQIPQSDGVVTQILPVKFGEAAKLVENLRPLLPDSATISANESSNAIIMTDTQNNIRRIAKIIKAIDTSVMSISMIHVFPLQFADAKALATVVTQLFANNTNSATGRGNRGGGRGGPGGGGGFPGFGGGGFPFGGGGGGGGGGDSAQSEARQANQRVIAVADEQSNSLIVSAPDDAIAQVTELVEKLDTSITDVTQTKIFRLQFADCTELATIITSLYTDPNQQNNNRNRNGQNRGGFGGGGFGGGGFGGGGQTTGNQQSQRSLLEAKVVAVGDPRTNALIVTAAPDTLAEIAETVGRLDQSDSKKQRVYTYQLSHADADGVANVLRGMLGDTQAIQINQQGGRLNQRQTDGAVMDTSDFSNTNGGGGGGGRGGTRR